MQHFSNYSVEHDFSFYSLDRLSEKFKTHLKDQDYFKHHKLISRNQ